jgi:hypothetical protein
MVADISFITLRTFYMPATLTSAYALNFEEITGMCAAMETLRANQAINFSIPTNGGLLVHTDIDSAVVGQFNYGHMEVFGVKAPGPREHALTQASFALWEKAPADRMQGKPAQPFDRFSTITFLNEHFTTLGRVYSDNKTCIGIAYDVPDLELADRGNPVRSRIKRAEIHGRNGDAVLSLKGPKKLNYCLIREKEDRVAVIRPAFVTDVQDIMEKDRLNVIKRMRSNHTAEERLVLQLAAIGNRYDL